VRIEIREAGTDEAVVRRDLLQLGRNMADLTPGFEDAGDVMRRAALEQFVSEGRYASGGWRGLAESTKLKRARLLGLTRRGGALRDAGGRFASLEAAAHPILQVTGALMRSVTRKYDPRHVERASADSLVFGSTVLYGIFHQSTRPRRVIPYRPFVAFTEVDKRAITKALHVATMRRVQGGSRVVGE
jgi:phage gpG-like protein